MVEEGRDCAEVLIQLAAVRSAINNTGKVILKDHLEHLSYVWASSLDRAYFNILLQGLQPLTGDEENIFTGGAAGVFLR